MSLFDLRDTVDSNHKKSQEYLKKTQQEEENNYAVQCNF